MLREDAVWVRKVQIMLRTLDFDRKVFGEVLDL